MRDTFCCTELFGQVQLCLHICIVYIFLLILVFRLRVLYCHLPSSDTCVIDGETRKIVASDKTKYQQVVSPRQVYERPCPPGTSFQILVCMCDHDSSGKDPRHLRQERKNVKIQGMPALTLEPSICFNPGLLVYDDMRRITKGIRVTLSNQIHV